MSTRIRQHARVLLCVILTSGVYLAASSSRAVAQASGNSGSKQAPAKQGTQPAPTAAQAPLPVPPPEVLLMMVRSALIAID